jgi:glycosyltransferase involved in cell wall biosynthesis
MDEFGLKQPHAVIPSYLPSELYQYKCYEYLGGLVYEGKVDLASEVEDNGSIQAGFKYADYEELARQTDKIGIDFHMYSARHDEAYVNLYKDIAILHPPKDYTELMAHLTRHDWGLVGNSFPTREWEIAFPNKLFEYIAACVPIVAINAKTCAEFIEEYGIGIKVESLDELASRWSEHRKCRENLIKVRKQFVMEKHIHKLEELYEKLT